MDKDKEAGRILLDVCLRRKCRNVISDLSCIYLTSNEIVWRLGCAGQTGCGSYSRFDKLGNKLTVTGGTLLPSGDFIRKWERPLIKVNNIVG